jgi:hypothetical protein
VAIIGLFAPLAKPLVMAAAKEAYQAIRHSPENEDAQIMSLGAEMETIKNLALHSAAAPAAIAKIETWIGEFKAATAAVQKCMSDGQEIMAAFGGAAVVAPPAAPPADPPPAAPPTDPAAAAPSAPAPA